MQDARAIYEKGRVERTREIAALEARARILGVARLAIAAAALGIIGGIVWGKLGGAAWAGLGALVAAFVALVFVHARVYARKERAAAALRFHERGLGRLDLDWARLPATSERFRDAAHPFTADLDVFGRASVMQLLDATETRFGEERLARLLAHGGHDGARSPSGHAGDGHDGARSPSGHAGDPSRAWPDEVRERQEAARELAARPALREARATAGGVLAEERPDPAPLLTWAEAQGSLPPGLAAVAWVLPPVVLGLLAAQPLVHASPGMRVVLVVGLLAVGLFAATRMAPLLESVSAREGAATRWRAMIAVFEREKLAAPLLVRLQARLAADGRRASDELRSLERIVGFVDARRNEAFRFLVAPMLLWDVHCAAALLRWRTRAGKHVRGWLDALGEVEALASLAAFAHEHPDFAWPELAAEPGLDAEGLGHPLIDGARRVGNDVTLAAAGRALVVTGSNMSGKSTLLRAIGVNVVLTRAGAPVCARRMRVGPARVATSMRISDSLEEGVSRFYAELRRLKAVLDLAAEPGKAPVLFLLDEILHGTNSRERVIGACAIVRDLLGRGALGAVSTHDLGITALERELGERVRNVHFEEKVHGEAMTFDYVLRPGIVQSSNALRLMRAVGIDVADAGPG